MCCKSQGRSLPKQRFAIILTKELEPRKVRKADEDATLITAAP